MNERDYKAARGEISRLERQIADGNAPEDTREYLDTLRKEVDAYEQGARSEGRPTRPQTPPRR